MNLAGEKIGYKEAWKVCKCGSKIYFNAYRPTSVPELCNRCQEIANMKQTTLHEFDGDQSKIHHFDGNDYIEIVNNFSCGTLIYERYNKFHYMFGSKEEIDQETTDLGLRSTTTSYLRIYNRKLSCGEIKWFKKRYKEQNKEQRVMNSDR